MALPVILDVDPGYDDAIAMMLAVGAPELEVRAVTTVAGNVPLEKTTRNALAVLSFLGREDIPVGAGARSPLRRPLCTAEHIHGEEGLGSLRLPEPTFSTDERGAVGLMASIVGNSVEPVTLVPMAPLTNVAIFLDEHPTLRERISRIVLMGGSIGPGNRTPAAEFNIYIDPEAARTVFESGVEITMAGLDVTREAVVSAQEAERIRSLEHIGEISAGLCRFSGEDSHEVSPVHDAVAVAAVVDPAVLETSRMRVDVECEGVFTRGETVCDVYGVSGREPNADVGVALDREAFIKTLYLSLGALAARA